MVGLKSLGNEENEAFVLMLKNSDTGFLEEELGQYKIGSDGGFIEGLYAEQTEEGAAVCLRVGVGSLWAGISDDLYNYIYDEYDDDLLPDFVSELTEIDGSFNPVWEARFLLSDNPAETEGMIKKVLAGHKKALSILQTENSARGGADE